MAYLMLQYDRPSDARHWHDYNGRVRDWIARLLSLPGAVAFMGYRTVDGSSPNTTTMLEFRTVDDASRAASSQTARDILNELQALGSHAKPLVVERSPYTPEPLRPTAG